MAEPDPRTLEALGLAERHEHPLSYPGAGRGVRTPERERLLPLTRRVSDRICPVLAGGLDACPAQLRHKMAHGVVGTIPMVRHGAGLRWRMLSVMG